MKRAASWSIERALQTRFLLTALLASLLITAFVAFHYGHDIPELERRRTLLLAEESIGAFEGLSPSQISAGARNTDLNAVFEDYPGSYGWLVLDSQGQAIAGSSLDWNSEELPHSAQIDEWYQDLTGSRRMTGKRFNCGTGNCWLVLNVSDGSARFVGPLFFDEIAFHVGIPVLIVSSISAWFVTVVVRRTLKPLRQISEQARHVGTLNRQSQISVANAPMEVRDLVLVLNQSLQQLSDAVDRERDFLLDASHSIRTPLAALKARIEQPSGTLDLARLKQDTDATIRLCSQLLAQAHSDRLRPAEMKPSDLREICLEVVSRMEAIAFREGLNLGFEGEDSPVIRLADSDAVSVALANLIENAIAYSPGAGVITVRLDRAPARISVSDQGPGVPPDQLAQLPKRFFTDGRKSRSSAGLGLSIARQVMVAHGGDLSLENQPAGGLEAALLFPDAVPVSAGAD